MHEFLASIHVNKNIRSLVVNIVFLALLLGFPGQVSKVNWFIGFVKKHVRHQASY